jgi:hypothetical protein
MRVGELFAIAAVAIFVALWTPGRAVGDIAPGGTAVKLTTPLATIGVQSDVDDLFPFFERELPAGQARQNIIQQVILQSGLPNRSDRNSPIEAFALEKGLFSIGTIVLFVNEFFLNTMETDFNSVLFKDLHPASPISPQLNIRVYKSNEAFQKATRMTGPEAANGLFVPDTNTIETYFPAEFLDEFYRVSEGLKQPIDQGAAAITGVRRTLAKAYFHEFVHALQHASGKFYLLSPFLAEGQAQFLAEKIARLQVLSPMIAVEALAAHPDDIAAAAADSTVQKEVNELRRNAVLSPEEYSKLRRASEASLGDGKTLSAMLTMGADEFYADPQVQRFYDLAWALFLFLDSGNDPASDFGVIREVAENLDADKHLPQLSELEMHWKTFLQEAAGPGLKVEEVLIHGLAPEVSASDDHMTRGQRFSAYKDYIPSLKAAPDAPDVLAYVADLFTTADDRDVFSTLYNRALKGQRDGAPTIGAPLRIMGRYVDTLMRIGLINQAATTIAGVGDLDKVEMTGLDASTRDDVALLTSYLKLKKGASETDTAKLDCELRLGRSVSAYNLVLHAPEIQKALKITNDPRAQMLRQVAQAVGAKAAESIKGDAGECGITKIDDKSWFISPHLDNRAAIIKEVNEALSKHAGKSP